ncbi:MAG TPA: MaoC family dehydratase N-terminal domain-containing protein [Ktedonobacterales bacterium]|jgi:acyl dehydratase
MPLDPALAGYETAPLAATFEAAAVARFADAIGDPNPLFREAERARAAGFAAPLAPPTFVVRYLVPLAEVGLDTAHAQVLHAEQEYEYARAPLVGDAVTLRHRVASVRQSRRPDGMAIMVVETLGESGGASLYTGRSKLLVREGAAAGASPRAEEAPARAATTPAGAPVGPLVKRVTQEQINAYAAASGDHNPIHLDAAAARAVGLDGTIAHGMLSMAFMGQLATDWLAAQPTPGGWVTRLRTRFQAMVRPGDTLTIVGALSDVANGHGRLEVWAENQRGERVTTGGAEVALPGA